MEQVYSYEEAFDACLKYFYKNDELASNVFLSKYALRNENTELMEKTPRDMHKRLSKEFARIQKQKYKNPLSEEEIFGHLDNFKYLVPQGSPMFGIGNNKQVVSLSNCYTLSPPQDSYGSILRTDEQLVQISKRRGGIGIDVSHLRPSGTRTRNAAKSSTGIVSFCERYSNSIREVGQGGRRAAGIITISIHHPESVIVDESQWDNPKEIIIPGNEKLFLREIKTDSRFYDPNLLDFASMKLDRTKVTGANVSIKLSNEFLLALEKGEKYEQRFPVDYKERGIQPLVSKMVDARKVWEKIIHLSWQSAEPGLLFWDNITSYNSVDVYKDHGFETICVNPCAELPLSELDSCRLMAQNLLSYVENPYTKDAYFNFDLYKKHTIIHQRLMDDLIDLELEKLDQIIDKIKNDPEDEETKSRELIMWEKVKKQCKDGRRTGLGITALADALAALNLKYDSDESLLKVEEIFKTQKLSSYRSSVEMAKELSPFPVWNAECDKKSKFIQQIRSEDEQLYQDIIKYGRRNINNLTIAPTGSLSLETQTSSGIEPLFEISHTRRKKINSDEDVAPDFVDEKGDKWKEFKVYHKQFYKFSEITGIKNEEESPWYQACANQIDWKRRVKIQAAAQKHIDHSISSTINLPEDVSEEKVSEIFQTAWKAGLKGITVYRDNCRTGVLIRDTEKEKNKINKNKAPKRPKRLDCEIHHCTKESKRYYVIVGLLEEDPYEIFVGINDDGEGDAFIPKSIKSGILRKKSRGNYIVYNEEKKWSYAISSHEEESVDALARMISTALRHGTDVSFVVHQLEKTKGGGLQSFSKVIARALKKYIKDGSKVTGEACPSCGSHNMIREEGCKRCGDCGYSACG